MPGSSGSTRRRHCALPGVVGVLTGADVAAMSHPFPAGIESPIPYRAAAHEVTRYVGEPLAVVVARDRYTAEDALELIEVEYEPLPPVLDPFEAAEKPELVASDRSFRYGDPDAPSPPPTSSSPDASTSPAGAAPPSSATASWPTGTRPRAP